MTFMTGQEEFFHADQGVGLTVLDFWRWSGSNLLTNNLRGILAEFLVANAVNACAVPRLEWDACDVRTPDGILIEVKSSAYVQAWNNLVPSQIIFGIAPARGWNAETNEYAEEVCRSAHVYVFCVLAHRDRETINPLDLTQWDFYVIATAVLNEKCPGQKKINLSSLMKKGVVKVGYGELRDVIYKVAAASRR